MKLEYVDGPLRGRFDTEPGQGPPLKVRTWQNSGTWMPEPGYELIGFQDGLWKYRFRG